MAMTAKLDYSTLLELKGSTRQEQDSEQAVTCYEAFELIYTIYSTRLSHDLNQVHDEQFNHILRQCLSLQLSFGRFLSAIEAKGWANAS